MVAVYIFRANKGGYYKIGRTSVSVNARLKAVSDKNEYTIFHIIPCADSGLVERFLHAKYRKVRGLQERFYLCIKDALWLRSLDEAKIMQEIGRVECIPPYTHTAHLNDYEWLSFVRSHQG